MPGRRGNALGVGPQLLDDHQPAVAVHATDVRQPRRQRDRRAAPVGAHRSSPVHRISRPPGRTSGRHSSTADGRRRQRPRDRQRRSGRGPRRGRTARSGRGRRSPARPVSAARAARKAAFGRRGLEQRRSGRPSIERQRDAGRPAAGADVDQLASLPGSISGSAVSASSTCSRQSSSASRTRSPTARRRPAARSSGAAPPRGVSRVTPRRRPRRRVPRPRAGCGSSPSLAVASPPSSCTLVCTILRSVEVIGSSATGWPVRRTSSAARSGHLGQRPLAALAVALRVDDRLHLSQPAAVQRRVDQVLDGVDRLAVLADQQSQLGAAHGRHDLLVGLLDVHVGIQVQPVSDVVEHLADGRRGLAVVLAGSPALRGARRPRGAAPPAGTSGSVASTRAGS